MYNDVLDWNLLTNDVDKFPCDGLQDLQAVSQSSLSQVYSSLIPQVAFQISFDSIAASTAQVSQVRPWLTVRCASAATVHHRARSIAARSPRWRYTSALAASQHQPHRHHRCALSDCLTSIGCNCTVNSGCGPCEYEHTLVIITHCSCRKDAFTWKCSCATSCYGNDTLPCVLKQCDILNQQVSYQYLQ